MSNKPRDSWGSRLGIILAVAGSAVGLGNFLRFPVQAVQHGGGAFMIPYIVSFLILGIPLMWIEWAIGRYGGGFGHGTAPGIFHSLWQKNRFIKYFGVIGIFGPMVIFIYYTYIESWLLAYAYYSLIGKLTAVSDQGSMIAFLRGYQGILKNQFFTSIWPAYFFFVITFFINVRIIYKGIQGGIEKFCRWAMPVLLLFAVLITIRVLTLGIPDSKTGWSVIDGLAYLWNPDFSVLTSARVWLAAAGQIFFTLSVGMGVIITYASYLKRGDDVVLSGLTAASTNEFAEVVLGGSIAIPAAFAFFGPLGIITVAHSGAFNLGFVTMPLIFGKIPLGFVFSFLWFILLFLAGVTSSVSMIQPTIAFMQDEFDIDRKKAVLIISVICFVLCQPAIFFIGQGVVDEMDFWSGTFGLVLFATIETILFTWVFGIDKAWEEMHHGAELRIPRIYKFIIKYITPAFLLFILGFWLIQDGLPIILMQGVKPENIPFILGTRLFLIGIFIALAIMVKLAWNRKKRKV